VKCLKTIMGLLTREQLKRVANAVRGTTRGPMEALRGLSAQLVALSEGNPQVSSAELGKAAESAVQTLVSSARRAKEQQRQARLSNLPVASEVPRGALHFPEPCRTARQEIPGPPFGRTLRGASSEVEQMHNYINSIETKLHEAIRNRDTDLIRS